ncbi:Phycobilisome protein [Gracilaria domingensis]|nr:Phycobilisome protein [Gracilaria domingensis]
MAFIPLTALPRSAATNSFAAKTSLPRRRPAHVSRTAPSMVLTEKAKTAALTPRAKQLQSYIQCHKSLFRAGEDFSATAATLFRKNDTARVLTPLDELATNANMLPGGPVAATILVHIEEIENKISEAAAQLDEVVQSVFQRNVRLLVRVVSYGIAAGSADYMHENNVGIMRLLNQELGIESTFVESTLLAVRDLILERHTESSLIELTTECFDSLIHEMSKAI